jgi:hypothetical protein
MTDPFWFGIGRRDGSPGGPYWKLRTSATDQDVYVSGTSPRFMYVSLHRDGNWFVRVRQTPSVKAVPYRRPAPVEPGLTHALSIQAHGSWGSSNPPATKRPVQWVIPPPGDVLVCFDVFLEDPGAAERGWPGGDGPLRTKLLGRRELPLGGDVCVVAHCEESKDATFTIPHNMTPEEIERARDDTRNATDPRMVLIGETENGAIALRFGRIAPDDGGRQEESNDVNPTQ